MIDTVGFKALIDYETYHKIKEKTRQTQRIDKETGEIEFEYDNGHTNHSHNYRVVFKVSDEYWDSIKAEDSSESISNTKKTQAIKKTGIPHVKLEFSLPKILWGHNLRSAGLELIYDAMYIVKQAVEEKHDCRLPKMPEWYCCRIDTCANYILSSEQEVRNYISYLSKLDYPRREPTRYEGTGIYFGSRQNTLKIYAKGPEFKAHDRKRFLNTRDGLDLYEQAQRMLRLEVEHKLRIRYITQQYNRQFEDLTEDKGQALSLTYLNHQIDRLAEEKSVLGSSPEKVDKRIAAVKGKIQRVDERLMIFKGDADREEKRFKTFEGYPQIKNLLSIFDPESEMVAVIEKLLSGTSSRVLQSLAVENRIRQSYSKKQASTFIAVYYSIITQGQTYAKNAFQRNIYYRALKAFRNSGISLVAGETAESDTENMGFPSDFRIDIDEANPYYQLPIVDMSDAGKLSEPGEAF